MTRIKNRKKQTIREYINSLPVERQAPIRKMRAMIRARLPKGYEEKINWGMISYQVPLKTYPETYNGQPLLYAALASQKSHMTIYLSNIYADQKTKTWFLSEMKKSGKKPKMGKSCVRFQKLDDLPLKLLEKAVARTPVKEFVKLYERSRFRN